MNNNCMHTYTGHIFNPLEMKEEDVIIEDIAHALSLMCRGGGHLKYFYTVGQHCINCAHEAQARNYSKEVILGCLLHDASEAYISDIIRPIKRQLTEYNEIEDHIIDIIFKKYQLNLSSEEKQLIRNIDDDIMSHELYHLIKNTDNIIKKEIICEIDLSKTDSEKIEKEYLKMFELYKM